MDNVTSNRGRLASLPYTNCDTRIVSLTELDLPETASDEEYREIYRQYIHTPDQNPNASLLRDAIESMRHGIAPPVAFPTETVYGLGADATNEASTAGIFAAKGRPDDNPLIVHVASVAHLERVTGEPLPEIYRSLARRFWPGPLTILLPVPKDSRFAKNVHPGQPTIGFRIPSSKYARFVIAATDRPIAGPSANSSGKPSPTTALHVLDDLKGKINFILDGGPCDVGVESTVIDGLHDPPLILRPGGVSQSEFIAHGREVGNRFADTAIGYKRHETQSQSASPSPRSQDSPPGTPSVSYEADMNGAPRAPGMKYRHYAPKGRLVLFSEDAYATGKVGARFDEMIQALPGPETGGKPNVAIGIISCHWAPFAGLPVRAMHAPDAMPLAVSNSVYKSITTIAEYHPPSTSTSTSTSTSIPSTTSTTTTPTNTTTTSPHTPHPVNAKITLYNIQIGPRIPDLAHALFGVLRLFDDLDCAYILAETMRRGEGPSSGQGGGGTGLEKLATQDVEDAVVDRMEKAAAERVD